MNLNNSHMQNNANKPIYDNPFDEIEKEMP